MDVHTTIFGLQNLSLAEIKYKTVVKLSTMFDAAFGGHR